MDDLDYENLDEEEDEVEEDENFDKSNFDISQLSSMNLKDFTDLTTNNFPNLEVSPFAQITGADGRTILAKKSTIVWAIEHSVKKLSNDRRLRVMQSVSFTEQNKLIIKHVSKRKIVQIGDWCIFKCSDDLSFMIGRVLSFALQENVNKSTAMWQWDASDEKTGHVGALCAWYEIEIEDNKLTGFLHETNKFTNGFHSLKNYVCTCPPPEFVNCNNEVFQLILNSVALNDLSRLLQSEKLIKNKKRL